MAVLTLHRPDKQTSSDVQLGNYINFATETVHILQATGSVELGEELEAAKKAAPEFAVLANAPSVGTPLNIAFVDYPPPKPPRQTLTFADKRLQFDLMTWGDAGDGHSVEDREYEQRDLADQKVDLSPGTRALIRFRNQEGDYRYFRLLMHYAIDDERPGDDSGFGKSLVAVQFEEVIEGRILVPLGIEYTGLNYVIATSEDLPAQFISRDIHTLAWSIRPSQRQYVGAELYERPFPVATVVFRTTFKATGDRDARTRRYEPHPPPWVGRVTQRNLMSRSYMNSTYSITVDDRGRAPSEQHIVDTLKEYQRDGDEAVSTVRYFYALKLVDGSTMEFRDFDPPVDVEDEN